MFNFFFQNYILGLLVLICDTVMLFNREYKFIFAPLKNGLFIELS